MKEEKMQRLSKFLKKGLETATASYETSVKNQIAYEYLLGRGISPESIKGFRLGYVDDPISGHEQYRGCLVIPSLGPLGDVRSIRFRNLTGDGPKYMGLPGVPTALFNTRAITDAYDTICITEGELDSVILTQCDLYSSGVCGADSWKKHHPRMFAGFSQVFLFGDGDPAGQKFAKSITDTLTTSRRISLPTGLDVNDLFLREGRDGILALMNE
jgi:DNA primase